MTKLEEALVLKVVNEYLLNEGFEPLVVLPGLISLAYTEYDFDDGIDRAIYVRFEVSNLTLLGSIDFELVWKKQLNSIDDFIQWMQYQDFDGVIYNTVRIGYRMYGQD